jgi:trehalose 6-phosphate synthase
MQLRADAQTANDGGGAPRSTPRQRLLVVSNRLPVVLEREPDPSNAAARGALHAKPGSGGLVSALLPVLRDRGGTWIGWSGLAQGADDAEVDGALDEAGRAFGFRLRGVPLTEAEVRGYYEGFANRVIWPLFHDSVDRCTFEPAWWDCYQQVNEKFADAVAQAGAADFTWIHDYQLIGVAQCLRARQAAGASETDSRARLGFFLHIPFPPLDLYLRLPWRFQILRMLLAHDVIGFQTLRDRNNFTDCVRRLLPDVRLVGRGHLVAAQSGERQVLVGVFPISIDFGSYARHAAAPAVAREVERLKAAFPPDRQLILGVDRLDYTKGLPERLRAFDALLRQHPELSQKVSLIQVVVPSREDIAEYAGLKGEVERLVSEINGRWTLPGGWVPIQYVYRPLNRTTLLAYYRCCQVALITPLKDGMNLVAKEFCACSLEEDSVLVLSEFAGAAAQLHGGALIVNPHDLNGVAQALHTAVTMPLSERRGRMRRLRRGISERSVFWWVNTFLRAAISRDLSDFQRPDDYAPQDVDALTL